MFLGVHALASLSEIIIHIRFPRLKNLSGGFMYVYTTLLLEGTILVQESLQFCFLILDTAYQALDVLTSSKKTTFTFDFNSDHKYTFIPNPLLDDYKAPQRDRIGAGLCSASEPGDSTEQEGVTNTQICAHIWSVCCI